MSDFGSNYEACGHCGGAYPDYRIEEHRKVCPAYLRERIAKYGADAKRITWIQENRAEIDEIDGDFVVSKAPVYGLGVSRDLREAIDAAMRADLEEKPAELEEEPES